MLSNNWLRWWPPTLYPNAGVGIELGGGGDSLPDIFFVVVALDLVAVLVYERRISIYNFAPIAT